MSSILHSHLFNFFYQYVTHGFAKALGIPLDNGPADIHIDKTYPSNNHPYGLFAKTNRHNILTEKPCLSNTGCCNDPNAVMAPLGDLKINRTIKMWSKCSLSHLTTYINNNGGNDFCLFRIKNSKSCNCK